MTTSNIFRLFRLDSLNDIGCFILSSVLFIVTYALLLDTFSISESTLDFLLVLASCISMVMSFTVLLIKEWFTSDEEFCLILKFPDSNIKAVVTDSSGKVMKLNQNIMNYMCKKYNEEISQYGYTFEVAWYKNIKGKLNDECLLLKSDDKPLPMIIYSPDGISKELVNDVVAKRNDLVRGEW